MMDPTMLFSETSVLYLITRWVILVGMFLGLTYLFRDRLVLEGIPGFFLVLVVLVPINVFLEGWTASLGIGIPEKNMPMFFLTAVLIVNVALLLVFTYILPGVTVSSISALLCFALAFSIVSCLIRFFIPEVPALFIGNVVASLAA